MPETQSQKGKQWLIFSIIVTTFFAILGIFALILIINNSNPKFEIGYDLNDTESLVQMMDNQTTAIISDKDFLHNTELSKWPDGMGSGIYDAKIDMSFPTSSLRSSQSDAYIKVDMMGRTLRPDDLIIGDTEFTFNIYGQVPGIEEIPKDDPISFDVRFIDQAFYFQITDLGNLPIDARLGLTAMGVKTNTWYRYNLAEYLDEISNQIMKSSSSLTNSSELEEALELTKDFYRNADISTETIKGGNYTCMEFNFSDLEEYKKLGMKAEMKMCALEGKYFPMVIYMDMNMPTGNIEFEMWMEGSADSTPIVVPDKFEDKSDTISSPTSSVDEAADSRKKESVDQLSNAIRLYQLDKGVYPPTADGGKIPLITDETIMTEGMLAELIGGTLVPDYIVTIPEGLRVGRLPDGKIIIGVELSDGTVYKLAN